MITSVTFRISTLLTGLRYSAKSFSEKSRTLLPELPIGKSSKNPLPRLENPRRGKISFVIGITVVLAAAAIAIYAINVGIVNHYIEALYVLAIYAGNCLCYTGIKMVIWAEQHHDIMEAARKLDKKVTSWYN